MQTRHLLLAGVLLAGSSVAAGAFGAHWLRGELARRGLAVEAQRSRHDIWETAVRYQMYHGLGLLVAGLLGPRSLRWSRVAGGFFLGGVLVFSGCLYLLVLTDIKLLGAIVPIGGAALIAGWATLAVGVARGERD